MPQHPAVGAEIPEPVLSSARDGEPDRLVAALLAPAPLRPGLVALAAFAAEVRAVPSRVREPMMGAIRLQWWHDAVDSAGKGVVSGHPTADLLGQAIARHGLDAELMHAAIEARLRDVSPTPFPDVASLLRHLEATEGSLFALSLAVAGMEQSRSAMAIAAAAGRAYGLARALAMPVGPAGRLSPLVVDRMAAAGIVEADLSARPQPPRLALALSQLVRDIEGPAMAALAEARAGLAAHPQAISALLPLAMVEPYFRGLNRQAQRLLDGGGDVTPLYRMWRLWCAHWRGRF